MICKSPLRSRQRYRRGPLTRVLYAATGEGENCQAPPYQTAEYAPEAFWSPGIVTQAKLNATLWIGAGQSILAGECPNSEENAPCN